MTVEQNRVYVKRRKRQSQEVQIAVFSPSLKAQPIPLSLKSKNKIQYDFR